MKSSEHRLTFLDNLGVQLAAFGSPVFQINVVHVHVVAVRDFDFIEPDRIVFEIHRIAPLLVFYFQKTRL